jgi:AcrR family transcriptional regulator
MESSAHNKVGNGNGNGRHGRAPYDLAAVLDIAVAAFNDHGYDATSMGQLAARLGTSKSAVYYHVTGKEDLLRLALERRRRFDRQVAALVDEARTEGTLRSDIDARTIERLLFGMINSIVEWYRPGGTLTRDQLAADVLAVAFDGLHVRDRS